jgi:hypothetical protein
MVTGSTPTAIICCETMPIDKSCILDLWLRIDPLVYVTMADRTNNVLPQINQSRLSFSW